MILISGWKVEAGNFGKHDERNRFGRSKLGHNLQRVYRDIRLVRYFPGEALCEPIFNMAFLLAVTTQIR